MKIEFLNWNMTFTAESIVSSFSGDSTTMNDRFSGGGGEIAWVSEFILTSDFSWFLRCDELSVSRALAAVRFIPLLVQGTAADCII